MSQNTGPECNLLVMRFGEKPDQVTMSKLIAAGIQGLQYVTEKSLKEYRESGICAVALVKSGEGICDHYLSIGALTRDDREKMFGENVLPQVEMTDRCPIAKFCRIVLNNK